MKTICVLLVFAHTFSCFRSVAVADWLQTDSYRHCSDYRNNIWSCNTNVKEEEACNQTSTSDGIIAFGQDTDSESCGDKNQTYRWYVNVCENDNCDVIVTIIYMHLNENCGNYLIISPGSSLVRDEASVVITGEIQEPKMFRVIDNNEMTVLLVIPEGITNVTWIDNNFMLSYKPYGLTTAMPDTTTHTYSTPEPSVDHEATVYVCIVKDEMFNHRKFKEAVAEMANQYCNETTNVTQADDVHLSNITGCPLTWPNWEKCITIIMSVSVHANNSYELTRSSLEEMWETNAEKVFKNTSFEVYDVPDDNVPFHLWLPISLGVAAIFTLLMVALWHFDIFNTSNKKDAPMSPDPRTSNASKQSWVSNSYQEVPPMTDLPYDDIYIEPRKNREIATSPNTLSVSHDRPQFGGTKYFPSYGYDNPSFDLSSERHHPSNADYHDDSCSDDDSSANTSTNTKSHHDHLHTAPKQVTNVDKNRESAL